MEQFSALLKPALLSIRTYEVKAGVSVMFESRDISFAGVDDAPDGFRAVVGDQQRAIGRDRDAYRAAPDVCRCRATKPVMKSSYSPVAWPV